MGDVKWIEDALAATGKSRAALARAMGINPSGITRLLKGDRELRAREVLKIERFLNARAPASVMPDSHRRRLENPEAEDAGRDWAAHDPAPAPLAPLYASFAAADDVTVIRIHDTPVSQEPKPHRHARVRGLWAFAAVGEAMAPRFEPGETVWVHPHRQPRAGDDVLFMERREPAAEIYCLLRKLVRETPKLWIARQHTPAREMHLQKDDYEIALILPRE